MNRDRLSSENLHATCVAIDGRAVLIAGPSGSGKSDLALRMLDRGFKLVSDDRTIVRKDGSKLLCAPPEMIKGKLEVRGIGIVEMEYLTDVRLALMVELASEIARLPDDGDDRLILGVAVPLVRIDAQTASAPSKLSLALDRLGLTF